MNMLELFKKHSCEKIWHNYSELYEADFEHLRKKNINILGLVSKTPKIYNRKYKIFKYLDLAISVLPSETIFLILVKTCSLSPGFILSGLYPQKKSKLNFSFDSFSSIGTHKSSVHPG